MSAEKKLVTLTIDGREVRAEQGTPLIEACKLAGVEIPHFCYHSHLSIPGNCRMCSVEVENARGLPISCSVPCNEGMVVHTDTERVRNHRAAVMEFLLINHPIDCPICDQAGECMLQIYYMQHDLRESRMHVEKVRAGKRIDVGPRVLLDQERCVECTRCIRFCDEVTGTGELRMTNRGDRCVITTFPETPLDNNYSVNTADICPVGALTQTDFRFKARVWFLQPVDTICPGCSRGCNVRVDYGWHPIVRDYDRRAYRLRPRINDAVNKAWMCDFGRDEYHRVNDERVTAAAVEGETTSLRRAVESAKEVLSSRSGEEILVLTSLESTLEEMHMLQRLGSEVLGGATVAAVPDRPEGIEDDLLLKADKHPNRKGAEWLELLRPHADLPVLLSGRTAVLIHRLDPLALDEGGAVARALDRIPVRVVAAANHSGATAGATHLLPVYSWVEKEGHWVNVDGRMQRIRRGRHMVSHEQSDDDLRVLSALSGGDLPGDPRSAFRSLALTLPRLAGLEWTSAGSLGIAPDPETQRAGT